MGPADLHEIIANLKADSAEDLLVGIETSDDAGVYRISDELALVQTLDFITPIVDDPFIFGRIAAVNSLSDVYAMGGKPLTAMNICCFPSKGISKPHLARMLEGGHDAIREAGAILVGGHTIQDPEVKYGLSVTGTVDPARVIPNTGARPGDRLILTKPLGTSTIFAGYGRGELTDDDIAPVMIGMQTLNRLAAEILDQFVSPGAAHRDGPATRGVHALTDVTGFGLAGHALEIAKGSGVGVRLLANQLPAYPHALDMIDREFLCGGSRGNRKTIELSADFSDAAERDIWLICDAQTSGGLLIAVAAGETDQLLHELQIGGVDQARIVGEVTDRPTGGLVLC
jgi:selenide, water dikinase